MTALIALMLYLDGCQDVCENISDVGATAKRSTKAAILRKIGFAIVLIPGIPIAAALTTTAGFTYLAWRSYSYAQQKIKGLTEQIKKTFVKVKQRPSNQIMAQEWKTASLSEEQVKELNSMMKQEIEEDSENTYVVVREFNFSKDKTINVLILALDPNDSILTVLRLCQTKWKRSKDQSWQIFQSNKLVSPDKLLKDMKKSELGVIDIDLVQLESFG